MYRTAITNYLKKHAYPCIQLKAVLFDMDGVLFDSMPYHAQAWHKAARKHGLELTPKDAYLHEGRTGEGTIQLFYQRQFGRKATQKEFHEIYDDKTEAFTHYPQAERMPGALELLEQIKKDGLTPMIVTGSGQNSLLEKINSNFPHIFDPALMVTAFDVKRGKPDPEPYRMALEKGKLQPNEAIVIENAPLGVQAAVAAGIFTIALNTGPLDDQVLQEAGANLLFPSMKDFCEKWEKVYNAFFN